MPKTRVKDRDSSRRDRKAPGNVLQRTPQPRPANVVLVRAMRHRPILPLPEKERKNKGSPHRDFFAEGLVEFFGEPFDARGG